MQKHLLPHRQLAEEAPHQDGRLTVNMKMIRGPDDKNNYNRVEKTMHQQKLFQYLQKVLINKRSAPF